MKTKHTAGPWSADCGAITIEDQIIQLEAGIGTKREWQAITIHDEDGPAEVVALCHPMNAHVIASVPELLAACHAILDCDSATEDMGGDWGTPEWCEWVGQAIEQARAAINKATGGDK